MRSLNIAASGMLAQQLNVEVISNNIANMTTTGFKRQRTEFQDLIYQNLRRVGAQSSDAGTVVPAGIQVGVGVKPGAVNRITEQGNLSLTERPYDLAIQGRGYFVIRLPSGETAYTRNGSFSVSAQGQLVTMDGHLVQPGATVPANATAVTVNAQGQVLAKIAGQTELQNVGQINLATFQNPGGLEAIGDNMFLATPASGQASETPPGQPGVGTVLQSFVETSNVNAVSEITSLISAQRAYEMNSKVITTSDQMLGAVSNLR